MVARAGKETSAVGTFRTSSDVRSMVAIRAKADIERLDPRAASGSDRVSLKDREGFRVSLWLAPVAGWCLAVQPPLPRAVNS